MFSIMDGVRTLVKEMFVGHIRGRENSLLYIVVRTARSSYSTIFTVAPLLPYAVYNYKNELGMYDSIFNNTTLIG